MVLVVSARMMFYKRLRCVLIPDGYVVIIASLAFAVVRSASIVALAALVGGGEVLFATP